MRAFVVPTFAAFLVAFIACVGDDPAASGNPPVDAGGGVDTSTSSSGGSSGAPSEDAAMDGSSGAVDSGDSGKVGYYDRVLQDSPVAYYRLGEQSGTGAADSVGTNEGNFFGTGFTLAVAGALNGDNDTAVSFTNACIRAGDVLDFNQVGSAFSIEAWVKPTDTNGTRVIAGKFNSASTAANGYKLQLIGTNKIRFVSTAGGQYIDTANTISATVFTHVVGTHDGTTARIYVDGVQAAEGTLPLPPDTGVAFTVGCDYDTVGGNNNLFVGVIDEVAVFAKALSAATISQHFQAR